LEGKRATVILEGWEAALVAQGVLEGDTGHDGGSLGTWQAILVLAQKIGDVVGKHAGRRTGSEELAGIGGKFQDWE
jgi:hypothetical protein